MSVDAEVFVIGAGPAGLTAAYCLTKEARSVIIIERDPIYVGGISRTVAIQGFPVRHRRPPLLLQVEGDRGAVAGDPARRFHRPAAAVAHLLQRQVLLLSAQSLRGAAQARRLHLDRLHGVLRLCQGFSRRAGAHLPRMGAQPVRRTAVPDFLQDLHREGVGHVVRRDFRRLGGAAHQGPRSVDRRHQRAQALAAYRPQAQSRR